MKLIRSKVWGVAVLAVVLMLPSAALAHDDYDDPWENHPFKLAAEAINVAAFAADQLVFRPFHWLLNTEPSATVTGHTEMDRRLPVEDLDNLN